MYELREVLEAYAAGKAATDMSLSGIKLLGDLCEMTRQVAVGVRESKSGVTDELRSTTIDDPPRTPRRRTWSRRGRRTPRAPRGSTGTS